jgi:two-component system cell cycle sensor histidine kinase/response regulator CckA
MGENRSGIEVSGIDIQWQGDRGVCTFQELPVIMLWVDSTLAGLMAAFQAMVGPERFALALQSEGRKSVEADWHVISQCTDFQEGFEKIADIASVAGWGRWELLSVDQPKRQCRFRVRDSWEGRFQQALGVVWGSGLLAGKLAGYCTRLFKVNCWAEQTGFIARGDSYDEFIVSPSERSVEQEIEDLLASDSATRADMAVALQKLQREVEERRRTEQELRRSRERFRELAELLPDTVFETDLQGTLTFVNQSAFDQFGYTREDFEQGLSAFDMVTPDDRERARKNAGLVMQGQLLGINEYLAQRKDGSSFSVLLHSAPIISEGKPVGMRGFVIDIREKKRLESQLQQALRMESLGTLAGGIAHDFNNLLMCIQGNTSLMLLNMSSSHPYYERLRNIEEYVRHGADLTRQLLGFAQGGRYEPRPLDVNELVRKSSRMFGRTRKEMRVHTKLQEDLWPVEADRGQLEQVLLNLYVNAWQAMPGGGDLYLETRNAKLDETTENPVALRPGRYVCISVADTGVGMDRSTQQRIFEPFFTTKEMGRGTGLGLASAYGVVKNHGGLIEVHSTRGEGTTFTIHLPAADHAVTSGVVEGEAPVSGTETILLVDDEKMILDVGRELLEHLGYRVLTARSGEEALHHYEAEGQRIDLVLLDMIMPGMSGSDTFEKLLGIDPGVRVLLSSGYSINRKARDMLDRGCRGFIQKPFDIGGLSKKLREVLQTTPAG